MWEDDDGTGVSYQREDDDGVAIETVEEHCLVSDHWSELQDHQACCGKDGVQMKHHANSVQILEVVVAFSWRGAHRTPIVGVTEDTIERQVLETSESEAKEVASRISILSQHELRHGLSGY